MSYRVRRKFTCYKFCVNGQICKFFLEPIKEYLPGFYFWNVGFAVGKSNRQLNDWYKERKNKRAKKIRKRLTGRSGIKPLGIAYRKMMELRWLLEPGDALVIKCRSSDPEKEFKALLRWKRKYPDWLVNEKEREIMWYRPPYPHEDIYKSYNIIKKIPSDPFINTEGLNYLLCFDYSPKSQGIVQSNLQKFDQLNQAQYSDTAVVLPIPKLP